MKFLHAKILLFALTLFVSSTSVGQVVYSEPLLDAQQRREMAIKLLEPIKKESQQNPKSHSRTVWLENFALIDPQWTADFIINNPIENSNILYDINAKVRLLSQVDSLQTDTVIKLLKSDRSRYYLFGNAGSILAECEQNSDLYSQVLQLIREESKDGPPQNINSILSFQQIAAQVDDPELKKLASIATVKFFESGKAKEHFDMALSSDHLHSSYTNHLRGQYLLVAPDKFKPQFGLAKASKKTQHHVGLQTALRQESFSRATKKQIIQSVDRYVFGREAENYMNDAGYLGIVALYDLQRALTWAKEAPNDGKAWAKIVIAPTVAKQDREQALKMIRDAYEEISRIDPSSRFMQNYNYPAPSIACAGLPVVESIAPAKIPTMIDHALDAVKPMSTSRMSTTKQHIFKTVATIAKYDLEKAKLLFEQHDDAIDLHCSPDFFRALIAIDPANFWSEFEQIPEKDSRGIQWPLRIRLAILPALCQKDDKRFWNALTSNNLLPIDSAILDNSTN